MCREAILGGWIIKQIDIIYLYIDKSYIIEHTTPELHHSSGYTQTFCKSCGKMLCDSAHPKYDDPKA